MECSENVTNETLASGSVDLGDMSAITERRIEDLSRQIKEVDNAANQIRAQWGSPSNPSIIIGEATETGIWGSPNKFNYYVTPEGRLMRIPKVENPELTPFTKSPIKGKGEEKKKEIKTKRKNRDNKDQKNENAEERRSKGKLSKDPSSKTDQKGSNEPTISHRTRSNHKEQKEDENSTECCVTLKSSVVGGVDSSALPANEKKGSGSKLKLCFTTAEQLHPSVIKEDVKEEGPSRSISKTEKDESVHLLRDNSQPNVTKNPCIEPKSQQLFSNGKNQGKGLPKQPSLKEKIKLGFQGGKIIHDGKILVPAIKLTRVDTKATVAAKAPVKRKREAKEEEETQKKRKCGDTKAQQHEDTKRIGLIKRAYLKEKERTDSRSAIFIDAKKPFPFSSSLNEEMEKKKVPTPQLLPSKPNSDTKISSKRKREEKEEIQKKRKGRKNKDKEPEDTKTRKERSTGKDSQVPAGKVDKGESKEPAKSHSRRLTRKDPKKPDDSKDSSSSNKIPKSKESTPKPDKDHSSASTNHANEKEKRSGGEWSRHTSSNRMSIKKDAKYKGSGSKQKEVKPLGMGLTGLRAPFEGASLPRAPIHNREILGREGAMNSIGDVKQSPSSSAPKTLKCVRRAPLPPTKRQPPKRPMPPLALAQSADPLSGIFANFITPNQTLLPGVYDPR